MTAVTLTRDHVGKLRRLSWERRQRAAHMPAELFGEPCWDMLLALAADTAVGRRVSVTSLCLASHVPSSTALRHIDRLIEADLVERCADPADGRRVFVELTALGEAAMAAYLGNPQCL